MRAAIWLAVALLAGCASTDAASRWVDHTLYGTAQGPPQAAYAGADRVKVYSEPDASAPVQGVLTLHEKVTRYQSEKGFAYVEAEGNVAGWVREQQLAASRAPAQKPAAEPAPEEEPAPEPDAKPTEPEPSVFDPY
jgi:hypothetical protein